MNDSTPTLSPPPSPAEQKRSAALGKARRMVFWTIGVLAAVTIVAVIVLPSQFMELRWTVLLKLGLGVALTIVLSAGLMAASFYSDASGHDDDIPRA